MVSVWWWAEVGNRLLVGGEDLVFGSGTGRSPLGLSQHPLVEDLSKTISL